MIIHITKYKYRTFNPIAPVHSPGTSIIRKEAVIPRKQYRKKYRITIYLGKYAGAILNVLVW